MPVVADGKITDNRPGLFVTGTGTHQPPGLAGTNGCFEAQAQVGRGPGEGIFVFDLLQ